MLTPVPRMTAAGRTNAVAVVQTPKAKTRAATKSLTKVRRSKNILLPAGKAAIAAAVDAETDVEVATTTDVEVTTTDVEVTTTAVEVVKTTTTVAIAVVVVVMVTAAVVTEAAEVVAVMADVVAVVVARLLSRTHQAPTIPLGTIGA
jgi:hypothetical protein